MTRSNLLVYIPAITALVLGAVLLTIGYFYHPMTFLTLGGVCFGAGFFMIASSIIDDLKWRKR